MTPVQPHQAAAELATWLGRRYPGTVYDDVTNATRRAARDQQALADALASLAGTHAEVVALLQSAPTRGRRKR